ncbi:MAG: malate synthase [Thermoanaerobaculia bacterium]
MTLAIPCSRSPQAGGADRVEVAPGVEVHAPAWTPAARRVLTPAAIRRLAALHRDFEPQRRILLAERRERQSAWDRGATPRHLDDPVTAPHRGEWRIAPLPRDLRRRRVEITGPVSDAKMVINMLTRNAAGERADAAMLDCEDSMKPSWANVVAGVGNLIGAVDGTLSYEPPAAAGRPAKLYRLEPDDMPLVMLRCRGLHLVESNLTVDGQPVAAGLFDLALAVHHTAATLLAQGKTPKYYVPKCEHYLEARWWNEIFAALEEAEGLTPGALRVTLLIETLPAAFQVEEILYELRERAAGLNVGRWDKIFSDIKVLAEHPDRVLADRATISLARPWMRAYAERLIAVCHRHGAFAMGGMAAFTPGRTAERREEQTRKVVDDKRFEAGLGHDGCWVSHPYFIGPALSAFPRDHQLDVRPAVAQRPDLLPQGGGPRTLAGLAKNVRVGIAYLQGWQADLGCVAWEDLMEDLATLEISRAQTWQWLRHGVALYDGPRVDRALVEKVFAEELARIRAELSAAGTATAAADEFAAAAEVARAIFTEERLRPFLTDRSPLEPGDELNT